MHYIGVPRKHTPVDGYVICTRPVKFPQKRKSGPLLYIMPGHILPFCKCTPEFLIKTAEGQLICTLYDFLHFFEKCRAPVVHKYRTFNVSFAK